MASRLQRFVGLCRELKLFTQSIVAIDGSKFKAVTNRERNYTQGKIERRERELEENIQRYLDALQRADRTQPGSCRPRQIGCRTRSPGYARR